MCDSSLPWCKLVYFLSLPQLLYYTLWLLICFFDSKTGFAKMSPLQFGHSLDFFSQGSMHALWKSCPQVSLYISSPSFISEQQIEHVSSRMQAQGSALTTSSCFYSSRFSTDWLDWMFALCLRLYCYREKWSSNCWRSCRNSRIFCWTWALSWRSRARSCCSSWILFCPWYWGGIIIYWIKVLVIGRFLRSGTKILSGYLRTSKSQYLIS